MTRSANQAMKASPWVRRLDNRLTVSGRMATGHGNTLSSKSPACVVCLRNSGPMNLLVSALKEELRDGEESQAGRDYCEAA